MKKLEQFLKDKNRESENIQVDPQIWDSIEKKLMQQRKFQKRYFLKIVASFLAIIAISAIIKFYISPLYTDNDYTINKDFYDMSLLEKDYKIRISNKVLELRKLEIPVSARTNFALLTDEFHALNANSSTINPDLFGKNELLEGEMINHYESMLKILDRMQQEINKIERFEKANHYENKKVLLHI